MIRVLDPQTVGQIAAGEVIENPLSVVKELVENAVDAGAARITVSLERGGIDAIEVSDDGEGIQPACLELAVRRHATSKLRGAEDLQSISTLGFRGEGLASIAAVTRLEIVSRTRSDDFGSRIVAGASTISKPEEAAAPPGTTVRACDLFANVPVRREFLRSPATEFQRIAAWLAAFTLAYPQIAFSLGNDGKEAWVAPAGDDLAPRLRLVFGKAQAQELLPLDSAASHGLAGTLHGFISPPGQDRADRRMQLLCVNGRLLRSALMAGAWSAGYATFAMSGRQPYGVLFLSLPPDHVDANVHPTKSDVRLRFGAQVFDAVRRSIADTLHKHAASRFDRAVSFSPAGHPAEAPAIQTAAFSSNGLSSGDGARSQSDGLRVVEQLDRTYIVAASSSALVVVDQHAAHERIAYEAIRVCAQGTVATEPLLVPFSIELDGGQAAALEEAIDVLQEAGLEIEPFGERTYRVVATPAGYDARRLDVRAMLEDLTADTKARDVRERVWATLACHSVVRAGEQLDYAEMTSLIERLQRCENPMHCPHGRPTIVRLEAPDFAKLFKRA